MTSNTVPPSDSTPRVLRKLADSRSAEIYAWGDRHVVKLFRLGFPREAIDQEAQNAAMIHALGVPTPRPEGQVEVKGRAGILFERCSGPTLYELLQGGSAPAGPLAAAFFELQYRLHQCRHPALPAATRTLESAILRARVPDAVKQRAIGAMQAMPGGQAVCHGDYHPLNVLWAPARAMALDWLDAGSGDPLFDIARSLLYLRYARAGQIAPDRRREFTSAYERLCREAWRDEFERADRWRLPVAVARLSMVADEAEHRALLQLIESDSGAPGG